MGSSSFGYHSFSRGWSSSWSLRTSWSWHWACREEGGLISPGAACSVSADEFALVEPSWRPSWQLRPVISRTPKAHPFQTNRAHPHRAPLWAGSAGGYLRYLTWGEQCHGSLPGQHLRPSSPPPVGPYLSASGFPPNALVQELGRSVRTRGRGLWAVHGAPEAPSPGLSTCQLGISIFPQP